MERLSVEEIKYLKQKMQSNMNVYFYDEVMKVFDELISYRDAEEQGLLLRLPCKVGDKVWAITSTANYSLGEYREVPLKHPQEKKIQSITITKNGLLYHVKDRTYSEQDFGKTVFLTKEEAEQALADMKGDSNG